ncbi:hypothetical protein ACSBOB_32410 [Mesorhizobium sp. ASY16-5R]|uniref:hypothetical protein n=1 Tax=Mesorhizobium sp. ASY16-5R TaxID=3445772 RepID=UPI003FA0BB10
MTTTPTLWLAATHVNETDKAENGGNSQSASKIVAIGGGRFVIIWEDDSGRILKADIRGTARLHGWPHPSDIRDCHEPCTGC